MDLPVKNCFPPSVDERCTRLILGSMPGEESLRQQQYYAHPRNAFWPIMGRLFDFDPALPYEQRLALLLAQGIGLWDAVGSCTRRGSLDSNIDVIKANDFNDLLARYSRIKAIYFNGLNACNFFRKHHHNLTSAEVTMTTLPSTSPANAVLNFAEKMQKWAILNPNKVLQ